MAHYIDADRLRVEIDRQEIGYNIDGKHAAEYDTCVKILRIIDSLQQEQPEVQNGKFVFPKYLYARTVDNKTIDVSYAPQSLDAVEYIKNDHTQPEVDLEKEFQEYWYLHQYDHRLRRQVTDGHGKAVLRNIARHFYELGLNARKEDK